MQGPEALHLEDALEDNPQTRSMVHLFERDAHHLDKYVRVMYEHANRIWNAEKELADATASLAFHMRQYDTQDFALDTDPDSILRSTLRQLSSSLEEISSWHQMCSAHIGDGMVYPLSRFLESDLRGKSVFLKHVRASLKAHVTVTTGTDNRNVTGKWCFSLIQSVNEKSLSLEPEL